MIFGFNTDVSGKDAVYHVQTEDRGVKNPVIDSIVYVGGEIVDRVRTPYVPQETDQAEIEAMVRNQHRQLVESIRSGSLCALPAARSSIGHGGFRIYRPVVEPKGSPEMDNCVLNFLFGADPKRSRPRMRC